ncbi:MAG: hypothetical protein MJY84_07590 [Bacteroidales bacterium]|nr:hypothetical protein [Bacteroidales bacterium]
MIERMTKYSFILPSGDDGKFLEELARTGLVDITRSSKPVDAGSSALLASKEETDKVIKGLEKADWSEDECYEEILAAVKPTSADNVLETAKAALSRLTDLLAASESARKEMKKVLVWGDFDSEKISELADLGYKTRFYCVSKKKYDPAWAGIHPLQEIADDGKNVWFVTISDDSGYDLPVEECPAPVASVQDVQEKSDSIRKDLIACKAELMSLREHLPLLRHQSETLAEELQLYLAQAGAGKAAEGYVTTFEGFAPTKDTEVLDKVFDGMGVIWFKEDAVKADNPPIQFKGNRLTRMFTVLTDMYGRPVYDEFDPTPYISIFFTLFFAMCMGDAGYGLMLLAIGLGAKKMLGNLAPLVTFLGGATVVMGIILHTFFGMDLSTAAWVPQWMKSCMIKGQVAGYDAQMLFSILIGVVHISIAMVLKAVYSVRRSGLKGSLGSLGWTLLIVGGVVVAAFALLGVISSSVTKVIVIVLGIISAAGIFLFNDPDRSIFKNIGSGLYETYNTVTGLLGDVLSYLRLYALGLAGGMLGNAFNSLGTSLIQDKMTAVGLASCILILVLGHVLNLAMCCLGAFVHPLRLNFLEFFKNSGYEGTGRIYSPLTSENITKE